MNEFVETEIVAGILATSLADDVIKARSMGYSDPEIAKIIYESFDAGNAAGLGISLEDFSAFQRICFLKMNERLNEMSERTIVSEKFSLH